MGQENMFVKDCFVRQGDFSTTSRKPPHTSTLVGTCPYCTFLTGKPFSHPPHTDCVEIMAQHANDENPNNDPLHSYVWELQCGEILKRHFQEMCFIVRPTGTPPLPGPSPFPLYPHEETSLFPLLHHPSIIAIHHLKLSHIDSNF
jgi:hypothetical protein